MIRYINTPNSCASSQTYRLYAIRPLCLGAGATRDLGPRSSRRSLRNALNPLLPMTMSLPITMNRQMSGLSAIIMTQRLLLCSTRGRSRFCKCSPRVMMLRSFRLILQYVISVLHWRRVLVPTGMPQTRQYGFSGIAVGQIPKLFNVPTSITDRSQIDPRSIPNRSQLRKI